MSSALNLVGELDRFLGDPASRESVIHERETLRLDASAEFPSESVERLDTYGLQRLYVPSRYGGDLDDFIVPMLAVRQVARRDLTVAVAHGKTFLGSVCAWIADADLSQHIAPLVLSGVPVSWGLTEAGRGSDLVRTATRYDLDSGRLTGGKWPINNATRGRLMCVLARTHEDIGPRSLTLVLADKAELGTSSFAHRPKVMTHGVRGADISGVTWNDATLPQGRVLGVPGHGLDTVLRALQLTRLTCTALSLGAADRALHEVLGFLTTRQVHGTALSGLPVALCDSGAIAADVLLAEATALVGVRHVGTLTGELSLVSSLVKYVVPLTVDDVFRGATSFLGARSQLVGSAGAGLFEKAARDNRVVGIFDGNSVVNLHAVINQFGSFARAPKAVDPYALAELLDPGAEPAPLDPAGLTLATRRGSSLVASAGELAAAAAQKHVALGPLADAYRRAAGEVMSEIAGTRRTAAPGIAHFDLAHRLAYVFAGACVLTLLLRHSASSELGQGTLWARAALSRVCERLGRQVEGADAAYTDLASSLVGSSQGGVTTLVRGWTHG